MMANLGIISGLVDAGQIEPLRGIALADHDPPVPIEERPMRVGFFPLAANPLHWGHILVGLSSMAAMRLDKVVFLIAGVDRRKPAMLPAHMRHQLGRSVIETFHPLFAYSSLALGTDLDGETNFERLLKLNAGQRMEAFYIAGADHCRRTTESGEPDTIQKLEWIAARSESGLHAIKAVFLDRKGAKIKPEDTATSLDVRILPPPLGIPFSSTAARNALREDAFSDVLGCLPHSYLLGIKAARLYGGKGELVPEAKGPPLSAAPG